MSAIVMNWYIYESFSMLVPSYILLSHALIMDNRVEADCTDGDRAGDVDVLKVRRKSWDYRQLSFFGYVIFRCFASLLLLIRKSERDKFWLSRKLHASPPQAIFFMNYSNSVHTCAMCLFMPIWYNQHHIQVKSTRTFQISSEKSECQGPKRCSSREESVS